MRFVVLLMAVAQIRVCALNESSAEDPEGRFRFGLLHSVEPTQTDGKLVWRLENRGISVAVQRIPKTDTIHGSRTLREVVNAIGVRFSEAEVAGAMTHERCDVAGVDAYCTDTWLQHTNSHGRRQRIVRLGTLVDLGHELVLIEPVGPESSRSALEQQRMLIQESFEQL